MLFLFFSQIAISQNATIIKLIEDGNQAFSENNFALAKEKFEKASTLDDNNKDIWYNLAAAELSLGEKDNACEHFYKSYLSGDGEALKSIKEYCPNFRNGTIMSVDDADEKPKFIYKEKEYPLIENNNLNPLYLKILVKECKKSIILNKNIHRKIYIQIAVNTNNEFSGKVIKVLSENENDERIKTEILSILENMVTYVSAKNRGKTVDIYEKWSIPLTF